MDISQLPIIQAFLQLNLRERLTITIGGTVSLLLLSYFLIIEPWWNNYQQLRQIVIAQQQDLVWMQMAAQQVKTLRAQNPQTVANPVDKKESLLSLVDRSARENALNGVNKRIEPQGENEVRVSFDNIDFNQLMRWLAQLQIQYQVKTQVLTVERDADKIKVRLTVVRF